MNDPPTVENPSLSDLGKQLGCYDNPKLLDLLSQYEAELQAKEIALTVLRAERARSIMEQRKSCTEEQLSTDAELALLRDLITLDDGDPIKEASSSFFSQHIDQFHQLEHLVQMQKACNKKSKQALDTAEKRHTKILNELNTEKERIQDEASGSDKICQLMENERWQVEHQLEQKEEIIKSLEEELKRCEKQLTQEREREKIIVLYLINERKQLLLKLNEMRMRLNSKNEMEDSPLVRELKRQVITLNGERENLTNLVNNLQSDKESLAKKVSHLEEDLLLIQQNILQNTREQSENLNRPTRLDGLVMANRGAFMSDQRNKFQLAQNPHQSIPTSASFPSDHYNPDSGIPGSKHLHSSLNKPVSRPSMVGPLESSVSSSGLASGPNTILPSNHSTVLLHRPSSRPSLGIKASNLPMNRNLYPQSAPGSSNSNRTTNYRSSTINNHFNNTTRRGIPPSFSSNSATIRAHNKDYQQQPPPHDFAILPDSKAKEITKRSSSLPRNIIHNAQLYSLLQK